MRYRSDGEAEDTAVPATLSRADQLNRNREHYPEAAAFIDKVRAVYPEAKVVYFGPARRLAEPLAPTCQVALDQPSISAGSSGATPRQQD